MAGIADPRCLMSRAGGGYGLLLGRENLTMHNVSAFQALRGKFAVRGIMDIYACAAADDGSTTGFTGNGRLLMAEIAGHAGALVRASDAVQIARHRYAERSLLHAGPGPIDIGIDCGRWEGNVWIFAPDGSAPRLDTAPGRGER